MAVIVIVYLAFIIFLVASIWKVYEKAGEPGWAAIVPFYSFYILCKFTGTKNWWLMFIPLANIYIFIVALINLSKSFGKDSSFAIGLVLLGFIFYPILGFGSAQYLGPKGEAAFQSDIDAIGT